MYLVKFILWYSFQTNCIYLPNMVIMKQTVFKIGGIKEITKELCRQKGQLATFDFLFLKSWKVNKFKSA